MIAIYARQSVDKKDSISIESQIDYCKKEIGNSECKIYFDKGYSGGNINRPDFEKMISTIKSNNIDTVVVYKLDRISRSLLDFAQIIDIFNTHNVEFISCTEKFDTSSPIGKAMLSIIMVFAQLERETIQNRIKDNYYARGKKGMYLGGRAPYGFKKIPTFINDKKTYTFEEISAETEVLKWMYNTYSLENVSLGKISKTLNEKGIKAPEGGNWDSCKISRILNNPSYVKANADIYLYYKNKGCNMSNDISDFVGTNGCYLYGKRQTNERKYMDITNHTLSLALHEGIINPNIFLKCQYKLSQNKQIKNTGKGKYSWLSGLLKCGYCNSALTIKIYKSKKNGVNYYCYCSGRDLRKDCKGIKPTPNIKYIEILVEKELLKILNEKSKVTYQNNNIDFKKENEYKIKLNSINEQISNLINGIATGNETVCQYINDKLIELDKEKNKIETEYQKTIINKTETSQLLNTINIANNWEKLDFDGKRDCIKYFISAVKVLDDKVNIIWDEVFLSI